MRFVYVMDPMDKVLPDKDTTFAFQRAAQRMGHQALHCQPRDVYVQEGDVWARVRSLTVSDTPPHATFEAPFDVRLADVECVFIRKDPPFDAEYLYATHLLEAAVRSGARVFNAPAALRDHNEKLAITEFDRYIAPTLVTSDPERILAFHAEQGRIVVKPLDGMGGSGIFHVAAGDPNINVILETVTQLGTRTVMAQRYLPQIAEGDKRILLIAGRPVPFALARVPKAGESRGNLAAGGTGHARPLSARDRQIAEALGPELDRRGLLLVGLDVIGDCLTEINVTSPTCFVEIHEQSGFDVAAAFADALEARVGVRA